MAFLNKHIKGLGAVLALVGAVALEGCVETIENDYDHSSSVYGEHDNTREFFEKIQQNSGG